MVDETVQVALMLARLYGLSCADALKYTQAFHDARRYPQNVRSPQTAIQRTQACPWPGLTLSVPLPFSLLVLIVFCLQVCRCKLTLQTCTCIAVH